MINSPEKTRKIGGWVLLGAVVVGGIGIYLTRGWNDSLLGRAGLLFGCFAFMAIPTVVIWVTLATLRKHAPSWLKCPTCGYDRRGLPRGAVCPECGSEAPRRPT